MKVVNRFFVLGLTILALQFSACSSDDGPSVAANEILDTEGLTIQLEWSTGGSTTQALQDIDLDLGLVLEQEEIDASVNFLSFESVSIRNFFADGDYTVAVEYFSGDKDVTYTLFISGQTDDSNSRVLEYEGQFSAGDEDAIINDLTITKEGNRYSVVD